MTLTTGKSSITGDVDFGPHSPFPIEESELAWFDYWMKGIPNGVDREAPLKIFVMGKNEWRDETRMAPGSHQVHEVFPA